MTMHTKIQDGRRDFDFFQGRWNVLHRRLTLRGAGSDDWDEFEGVTHCQTLMGGLCNVDENDMPARGFQGLTFRTFNLRGQLKSIIYSSIID